MSCSSVESVDCLEGGKTYLSCFCIRFIYHVYSKQRRDMLAIAMSR